MATAGTTPLTAQNVSHAVITAAMKVHTDLGPGLLESTYLACLQHELAKAGFRSESQVGLPVYYDGVKLDLGYRIDLLVEGLVICGTQIRGRDCPCPSGSGPFVPEAEWQIAGTAYKLQCCAS